MQYYIDSGHFDDIKRIAGFFPLSGLTTNPEILSKEATNPFSLYKKIHCEVPQIKEYHMQVVSVDADAIVNEALHMSLQRERMLFRKRACLLKCLSTRRA